MNIDHKKLIENTLEFVKRELANAEGGHDWWHIYRVWNNAKAIMQNEDCNELVVNLGSLLHDIADSKFYNGNEEVGPKKAKDFLGSQELDNETIAHVENIIRNISFKNTFDNPGFRSIELDIVRDADRLDAIGAIGIARAFNYGGHTGSEIYNPNIKPKDFNSRYEYKNSKSTTINHFYEKLLKLKGLMTTETGKKLAEQRHEFMKDYLQQFYDEWNGKK